MERLKGYLYLTCAFALAGTSVISGRFLSGKIGAFTITSISLFFAVIFLLPICRNNIKSTICQMGKESWIMTILQAFFGIFLFRAFLLHGLSYTSAGEAGILTGATPAATVILSSLVLKEPLCKGSILGITSTISGILLLQGIILPGNGFTGGHIVGNILVLLAALSESSFNIISRMNSLKVSSVSAKGKGLNPLTQTALVSVIAFFLCIIPSLFENPFNSIPALGFKDWFSLVWYGVFVTALAFIFWYSGIKRCKASVAAAFSGMMPFTSLILSVFLLGEASHWQQWSGGFLVILGMFMIGREL